MKFLYLWVNSSYKVLFHAGMVLLLLINFTACSSNPTNSGISSKNTASEAQAKKLFIDAMVAIKAKQYEKGILLFQRVIEKSDGNAIPYINLALVYKKLESYELAENYFLQGLRISPENPVAQHEYAQILRKMGRFPEARQLYEKALVSYPRFAIAHKNLGILCDLYLRDFECALKHYEIYSNMTPLDKAVKIWISDLQR
ncbi:MAG: tetratricopeptide repeat protein [Gallionella sp.]